MEPNIVIRNIVLDLNARGARVVVVKLPRGDGAVILHATLDVNHSRGTEIRPGELLFTRPVKFHRFARDLREPRRFHGTLAGVLAAVRRAGIRDDDANLTFG